MAASEEKLWPRKRRDLLAASTTHRRFNRSRAILAALQAALALSFVSAAPAQAQGRESAAGDLSPVIASPQPGPSDPAEMEAFLDSLFNQDLARHHIAGAVIAVVKDGRLFFAKGYGYADLKNRILVDPDKTLFRIGSITKLFTWTAVMQLVEQGKLDLNADINSYLDFHILDTYAQPITLKHLMTHTAGFEDRHADMVTLDEANVIPERTWLVSHVPQRVSAPGEYPAYSNYGAALAGYIVARASGLPYSQYVQERILAPLGMQHSTACRATSPESSAQESVGYMYEDGAFHVFPDLVGQPALQPIGALRATATDMARFMIAHLQDGRTSDGSLPETRILRAATAQRMHGTLYTADPRLLGSTYGFFEFSDNRQRVIGHGGEAEPMQSTLLLLPERNLGIFVSYNSMGGGALTRQHLGFQRAFFDHYYSVPAVAPIQPPADFSDRAERFVGAYRSTQNSHTTLEKYAAMVPAVEVKNPGDGTLILETPWGDWRFVEEQPLYFRQVDASFHILFRQDQQGRIASLFTDYTPMMAFERMRWYELPGFNMALLLIVTLMFLSTLLVAGVRAIRKRRTRDPRPTPGGAGAASWLIVGVSLIDLLFMAGTVLWGERNLVPVFGVAPIFKIVLLLGLLSAPLTAGSLLCAFIAWKNRYWGQLFRVYYTGATLAAVAFLWFLNQWNLLGWRF